MSGFVRYTLKRVLISLVTLFVLVTIVFFLMKIIPGEPYTNPKLLPEVKANLDIYYGFDKPLLEQYLTYLSNLLKGDFGYSLKYVNRTVNDIIGETFPFSLDLGLRAVALATGLGLTLGVLSACNKGTSIDHVCIFLSVLGISIPDYLIGAILQYFFGIRWGLLPIAMYKGFEYTILPSFALSMYTLSYIARIMRSSMVKVNQEDYIVTARAKGLSEGYIALHHKLRNAILPVLTVLGPNIAGLLTGTFVIETLFVIPGMGKYFVESIMDNDYTMVCGLALFFGSFMVFCNLAVDLLYGIIDPRIRIGEK